LKAQIIYKLSIKGLSVCLRFASVYLIDGCSEVFPFISVEHATKSLYFYMCFNHQFGTDYEIKCLCIFKICFACLFIYIGIIKEFLFKKERGFKN